MIAETLIMKQKTRMEIGIIKTQIQTQALVRTGVALSPHCKTAQTESHSIETDAESTKSICYQWKAESV